MSAIMCKQLHKQEATFYLANIVKTSDDIFDVAYDKCNLFLDLAVYITQYIFNDIVMPELF